MNIETAISGSGCREPGRRRNIKAQNSLGTISNCTTAVLRTHSERRAMKSTIIRFSPQPSFPAFIASISHKYFSSRCDPTKLWTAASLVCQKCNYQTGAPPALASFSPPSASCHRHVEFCRRSRSFVSHFGASRSNSSSSNEDNPLNKRRTDLPSHEESRRSQVSKKFSHVMDHLQSNIFIAGQRLNDLTGYSGIEVLKKEIEDQGQSCVQL